MLALAAALHLVVGMALFTALEVRFAAHAARWWRRRFLADALLWLVHPFCYAVGVAGAAALVGALGRLPFAEWVSALPGWSQIPLAVVMADAVGYGLHRAYHRFSPLWAFHVMHHTSTELDWLSSSRLHPVSQAINSAVVAAPLLACGLPMSSVVVANAVIGLWAVVAHANVRLPLGPLGVLLVSPSFHRHHHGRSVGPKNLGGLLAIWDRIFGTWAEPAPIECGAVEAMGTGWVGLLLYPFTRQAWPRGQRRGLPANGPRLKGVL
jgi:sterol desaturase/sphingolipid hydroxylase (fatty acid hydroxylase superfamily)